MRNDTPTISSKRDPRRKLAPSQTGRGLENGAARTPWSLDEDVFSVVFDDPQTYTANPREILRLGEPPILVAIIDDGLSQRRTDARQLECERGRIRGVDVDGPSQYDLTESRNGGKDQDTEFDSIHV